MVGFYAEWKGVVKCKAGLKPQSWRVATLAEKTRWNATPNSFSSLVATWRRVSAAVRTDVCLDAVVRTGSGEYWLNQCFSQHLWDRGPVNSFFIRRGPGPNRFTRKYLPIFLSSYIKLTYVLINNYSIIIKRISTLMYTVWHVDRYKIGFKLVISHWTSEIL